MVDRDYKTLPFTNIKSEAAGRIRSGIAAVFGNVDSVGDRMMPGAFTRTINNGPSRVKHLWNHSWQHPPIAAIKELREVPRNELPPEVLAKAPDATGGLLVRREYYNSDLSNWILEAIDAGDINEMSFAFDVVRSSTVIDRDPDNSADVEVREINEVRLFDTSDVLWGANAATVANGAKNLAGLGLMPLGVIASQLTLLAESLKSGRRNSSSDQKLVDLIHDTACSLGAVCDPGTNTDSDGKNANAVIPQSDPEMKLEPAAKHDDDASGTSLSLTWLELQKQREKALRLSSF